MYQFGFIPLTLYVKYVLNIIVGLLRVHFFLPTYVHIIVNIKWIFAGNESLRKSVSYARTLHDNKHNLRL